MKKKSGDVFDNNIKILLGLILPVFMLYAKSLHFDFTTLDEQWMIVRNGDYLKNPDSLREAFTKPLAFLYYRPLLLVSIILDYQLGQLSPFIYHFSNLIYHIISVLLLYRLLNLLNVPRKNAYFFSLLFSLHPIALHAVAWIPGRNDSLLCIFTLSAFIFLIRYLDQPKIKFIFLHLLFFICALLTKENAVLLPLIFFTICLAYKNTGRKKLVIFILVWLCISFGWLLLRNNIVENFPATGLSMGTSIASSIAAFLLFTGKTILPFQQSVLPIVSNSSLVPGILTLAVLLILVFRPGLKDRKIAFLGLVIFITLLAVPVWFGATRSGNEHYEHRAYTSMAGLILFFSQVKFNFNSSLFKYIAAALLVFFSVKTWVRMNVYKDKYNFVENAVKERPDFYLFHFQMGEALHSLKKDREAIPYFNTALSMRPDLAKIYNGRGSSYYYTSRYQEAIEDFNVAIEKSKAFVPDYFLNRGLAFYMLGDIKNSMRDIVKLSKCCRSIIPPAFEKSLIEKWNELLSSIGRKIKASPGSADLYYQRAMLFYDIGENEKASADLKKANELNPNNTVNRNVIPEDPK
jgi:tetratricopeptide (TPR) repeat protein